MCLSTDVLCGKQSTSTLVSGINSKSEAAGVYCVTKGFQLVVEDADFDGEDPRFVRAGLE